ncbi:MAG: glycoside hydrolase family 2 protein [Treponema sp.]|nr:glycoside hydrolase family 2 protein [Treponema sp.]
MKTYINSDWQFVEEFDKKLLQPALKKSDLKSSRVVSIPHTVAETPFNYFDDKLYQKVSGYRKTFKTAASWKNSRIFVTFEGAAQESTVYFNGKQLGVHSCGYTAFTYELTDLLSPAGKENVLAVKLDSRESLDIPPFGFVIDYMTYGGIYRDVYIEEKPQDFIKDVFVHSKEKKLLIEVTADKKMKPGAKVNAGLVCGKNLYNAQVEFPQAKTDKVTLELTADKCELWSPEKPVLYNVEVILSDEKGKALDKKAVKFGFRDIEFKADGFYLNGKKYRIRGLDRHQSYAYLGYALPASAQIFDAKVLKYELGLNAVRTSHYPQSQDFINACDELGLLVFTEIPGWQHIGSSNKWRNQAVRNVEEMVLQYRNHPSIILWGVRINESPDDDELYERTNQAAHALDPSRPTGGVRCIKKSSLLEDVYTYNDFVHNGIRPGCEPKKAVTSDMSKGYLISEYNGHMYPVKIFDDEIQRTNHAIRHATVIDAVAGKPDIAGSFGWCAFDYNTHEDFGSGDRICYHGVMDMFRNPKLAASVYQSQQEEIPVLEVSSSMDVGEHPACVRGENWIFTNADSVKMYFRDIFICEYTASQSPFKNLKHGPILIDDYIGERLIKEEHVSKSVSDDIKCLLNFVAINGQAGYPAKQLCAALRLLFKGYTFNKIRKFYDSYVGNWGGEASVFRFEAIKDGKVVKVLSKGPVKSCSLAVEVSSRELDISRSWDAAVVRISMRDQFGDVLPYCNEVLELEASGAVQVAGPSVTALRGGFSGCFVRTNGTKGKGTLTVRIQDKIEKIDFTVK